MIPISNRFNSRFQYFASSSMRENVGPEGINVTDRGYAPINPRPQSTTIPVVVSLTGYELQVLEHYRLWGWVEKKDRYLIDGSSQTPGASGDKPLAFPDPYDEYNPYDEPEQERPPDYPFHNFNYGP
jgi:hypothetical protein